MNGLFSRQTFPFFATTLVCVLMYGLAGLLYPGFFSFRVPLNILTDNAFLGIAATGLTFVILSGGIDLSVGASIGFTSILLATLIERAHWPVPAALAVVLLAGLAVGAGMGLLIRLFELPPFPVTLAGLFFYRGLSLLVSTESVAITHPGFQKLSLLALPLGGGLGLSLATLMFLALLVAAMGVAHWTAFGRNVYALGGSESSALLMGLPVGPTKVAIYALSGACSALAGVAYTLYTASGNAVAGTGLELDAIAAVVVGGTLLSGGVGYVAGTLVGVLTFGIIQTAITFQGTLSSWWTKIAIGLLLLFFIILQKIIQPKGA